MVKKGGEVPSEKIVNKPKPDSLEVLALPGICKYMSLSRSEQS